jgi:hypothetical protein
VFAKRKDVPEVLLLSKHEVVRLGAGVADALAVCRDNTVYVIESGRLADPLPLPFEGLCVDVSAGNSHYALLAADGRLFMKGGNS